MMSLRFLDLTVLFRFLAVETKDQAANHQGVLKGNGERAKAWYKQLRQMSARAEQRRQLLNLSDAQLDDIGITREQMFEEANKPFWKA